MSGFSDGIHTVRGLCRLLPSPSLYFRARLWYTDNGKKICRTGTSETVCLFA